MNVPVEAPWIAAQIRLLLGRPGHAFLLQGPSGLGQYRLALGLASAWLCERPGPDGACQGCASCHAVRVRTHADLFLLMPETVMQELEWPLAEQAQREIDKKERKPSKVIRVEGMRDAIEFSQRTSARGRGKAVLVFPAERMNHVTANALLKTLEEPPGEVRFVLASEAAHQLLPTIVSRCLTHAMAWPAAADSLAWLQGRGLAPADAAVLLRAAGGRPVDALQLARSGRDARQWAQLPRALARGDGSALEGGSPALAIGALQKLCHDLLALSVGAAPRFFAAEDLPPPASVAVLSDWSRALALAVTTQEHPFNAGLMLEALVSQARAALNSTP